MPTIKELETLLKSSEEEMLFWRHAHRDADKRVAELEAENQRLMDEIRDLEWKIYRPLKEGEMTQEGDQVLGPEEDAKWVPVTGNYRLTPSALYPAHCHYRRLIVDEIKKEMEGDYFYRKCVAGKESARSKRIKVLEADNAKLRAAASNLIADVQRRYPGEELRCPYMIALDKALRGGE